MFKLREWDDDDDEDWWFASTAIPLLAATIGPLANVMSIAALVVYWRECLVDGVDAASCPWNGDRSTLLRPADGHAFKDPRWCLNSNVASLVAGFVGNFFLLCNFTNRIRYIIALPVTILLWYIAGGILVALTISMHQYAPPIGPQQIFTQGFWYAVLAACMYMLCAMLLMVNMLGYFLGHYPQHFTLTDSQRTLILQTMLFFVWLAGGGGIFAVVESKYGTQPNQHWNYVNALYFCDVTILTVGFGDLYATSNIGRGLILPYSVGGIIMLGLMVSSITKFAGELGQENVIRRHVEHGRVRTIGRTVSSSLELERRQYLAAGERPVISAPFEMPQDRQTTIQIAGDARESKMQKRTSRLQRVLSNTMERRKPKLILLREEKDRFEAMRHIQEDTAKFKRWSGLTMSVFAFSLLWCGGAAVFWRAEGPVQGMTYFDALYFCYVSLLTIGYGDLAPQSNAGRPFFVFWSLIAVPTMTILVSDLGDTVISKFKQGTFRLADFTVLPKKGVWRKLYDTFPSIYDWLRRKKERRDARKRVQEGFHTGPDPETAMPVIPTIEELAGDEEPTDAELARRLPDVIRRVAKDIKNESTRRYTYEEWVDFTRMIRFSAVKEEDRETEVDDSLVNWDWLGEDSPMLAQGTEAEFVFERLVESLNRYVKRVSPIPPNTTHGVSMGLPSRRRDDSEEGTLRHRRGDGSDEASVGPNNEIVNDQ